VTRRASSERSIDVELAQRGGMERPGHRREPVLNTLLETLVVDSFPVFELLELRVEVLHQRLDGIGQWFESIFEMNDTRHSILLAPCQRAG
jgi:hypothetical protein